MIDDDYFGSEIIVQDYIPGRDVTVGVWGNQKCEAIFPRTIQMHGTRVATAHLKFSFDFQRRHGVKAVEYKGGARLEIQRQAIEV